MWSSSFLVRLSFEIQVHLQIISLPSEPETEGSQTMRRAKRQHSLGVVVKSRLRSGEITAGDSRLRESGNVNTILDHLLRDEFGITFLGERKHIPGGI